MAFNSLEYLYFFVFVLGVCWLLVGLDRLRTYFILAASLYFYASNNSWQTFLLLSTTTVDYFVCLGLGRVQDERRRRHLLAVSLISNLGMLAVFKYYNFFGHNISTVATFLGIRLDWVDANILLPVGISFYTFEALSYTIDVYRRRIPPERDYVRLAFLVSFFPHLIAGPIVRAADFFPQIGSRLRITVVNLEIALLLIFGGLIKKLILADSLAGLVDAAFAKPEQVGTIGTWIGVYAFAFQIYFDFSGYTDIARGCAKLLGYELPINFNAPYIASNVTDFWRRWHISLSTWLRDYLYISLGGNRMKNRWGVYRNLMVTMTLGGLWHGAAWHFLVWGFIHGAWLSVERAFGNVAPHEPIRLTASYLVKAVLTFTGIVALWLVFRSDSLETISRILNVMFTPHHGPLTMGMLTAAIVMLAAWGWQFVSAFTFARELFLRMPIAVKALVYATSTAGMMISASDAPRTFIYFQF